MEPSVILLLVLAGLLAILWLTKVILHIRDFKSQLDYFNREIKRASPRMVKHWKRRRRKLWWHFLFLPF